MTGKTGSDRDWPSKRGVSLIETVVAMTVLSIASLAIIALVNAVAVNSQKIRRTQNCERLAQSSFSHLKNISYYSLFAVDSSSAIYEGQPCWATPCLHVSSSGGSPPASAAYPYFGTLNTILGAIQNAGFTRFTVTRVFMRRDSSNNLVAFKLGSTTAGAPCPGGGHAAPTMKDANDPQIEYYDQTCDGDYYETYTDPNNNNRTVAEEPDTHMKEVTLDIYDASNKLACSHTELISLEQLMAGGPDSESLLTLTISSPTNNGFVAYVPPASEVGNGQGYDAPNPLVYSSGPTIIFQSPYTTPAGKPTPYPSADQANQFQVGNGIYLPLNGQTAALSTVNLYLNGATTPLTPACSVPTGGLATPFNCTTTIDSSKLKPGHNIIMAQAVKSNYTSPFVPINLTYEYYPPRVINTNATTITLYPRSPYHWPQDQMTLNTLAPCIQVGIEDNECGAPNNPCRLSNPVSTTVVSGIDPSSISVGYSTGTSTTWLTGTGDFVYAAAGASSGTITGVLTSPLYSQFLTDYVHNHYNYYFVAQFGDNAGYMAQVGDTFPTNNPTEYYWGFTPDIPFYDSGVPQFFGVSMAAFGNGQYGVGGGIYDVKSGIDPTTLQVYFTGGGPGCTLPQGPGDAISWSTLAPYYNVCTPWAQGTYWSTGYQYAHNGGWLGYKFTMPSSCHGSITATVTATNFIPKFNPTPDCVHGDGLCNLNAGCGLSCACAQNYCTQSVTTYPITVP